MINFYKTINDKLQELEVISDGCWVNVVAPTENEIAYLIDNIGVDKGFINSVLDEEESSRIEIDNNQTLIIIDIPICEEYNEINLTFSTMPIGIILINKYIIIISLKENDIIEGLFKYKSLNTNLRTNFLLRLLLRVATRFLAYLKEIDKISAQSEKALHKSMKNKELFQLMGLKKSLVYFSTSLRANEVTIRKILRGNTIKMYEEDEELLEDVLIEVNQAIEMCKIYSDILSGTMEAFASIISNNLNIVMKRLSAITIIMAIPTILFSFYGMNVTYLPLANSWFPSVFAIFLTILVAIILYKKRIL